MILKLIYGQAILQNFQMMEGRKIDGNLISLLRNIEFEDFKYAWFIPESGLWNNKGRFR